MGRAPALAGDRLNSNPVNALFSPSQTNLKEFFKDGQHVSSNLKIDLSLVQLSRYLASASVTFRYDVLMRLLFVMLR